MVYFVYLKSNVATIELSVESADPPRYENLGTPGGIVRVGDATFRPDAVLGIVPKPIHQGRKIFTASASG